MSTKTADDLESEGLSEGTAVRVLWSVPGALLTADLYGFEGVIQAARVVDGVQQYLVRMTSGPRTGWDYGLLATDVEPIVRGPDCRVVAETSRLEVGYGR